MLNAKKTKVMKIRRKTTDHDNGNIKINNEYIQNVKQFTYLGVVFTDNYDDTIEIKRRLAIARNATVALTNIWKDKNISLCTKKRLLNSLVFPIASYGSECWTLKESDKKKSKVSKYGVTDVFSASAGLKRRQTKKSSKR
ncbi:uncharacterized protein LOC122244853 [Penaeus japonicus]|uniref:uncharacterized protein LOC122244853 n=1 Tax=Penaeus japonicus TaxID=27405 RepID=UPI001C70CCCE|nr:uncharacterized protein LOC122244853 [Penaeus japonicus]